MPTEEPETPEEIPGVNAPPTRRQVRGIKKWIKLAAREHAKSKQIEGDDAAKAAAVAIAHIFERRHFG